MALEMYKSELNQLIQKMLEEGLVSSYFICLQAQKEHKNDYVLKQVVAYSQAVKKLFISMSVLLEGGIVDFQKLKFHAHDLFHISNSIGAENVRITSAYIIEGCRSLDKDYCDKALYATKHEYQKLSTKLEEFLKIERKIIDYEDGIDRTIRIKDCWRPNP